MAKKRKKKSDFKTIVISLSIAFSIALFLIKIGFKNIGWLEVFSPIILVFILLFIINVLKTTVKKI